jgi:hypothetical protein
MYSRTRACAYAGVLVVVAGGALRAGCSLLDPESGWDSLPLLRQVRAERERGRRLDAADQLVLRNSPATDVIRAELYDGRLSLLEAVARYRAATGWWPPSIRQHLQGYPGSSEEERYARHLIARADNDLKDDPRREAIIARLEAELRRYLTGQAGGPVDQQVQAPRSASP